MNNMKKIDKEELTHSIMVAIWDVLSNQEMMKTDLDTGMGETYTELAQQVFDKIYNLIN